MSPVSRINRSQLGDVMIFIRFLGVRYILWANLMLMYKLVVGIFRCIRQTCPHCVPTYLFFIETLKKF